MWKGQSYSENAPIFQLFQTLNSGQKMFMAQEWAENFGFVFVSGS